MLKPDHLDDCWPLECEKFLVRLEYEEAEGFVLAAFATERAISSVVIAANQA